MSTHSTPRPIDSSPAIEARGAGASMPAGTALSMAADAMPATQATSAVADECWRTAFDKLAQVLGRQGLLALFMRSLELSRHEHPALALLHERGIANLDDLLTLRRHLGQLPPADVDAAQTALLRRFGSLLGEFVGPAMTTQLLRSVLETTSSGGAAEDPKS